MNLWLWSFGSTEPDAQPEPQTDRLYGDNPKGFHWLLLNPADRDDIEIGRRAEGNVDIDARGDTTTAARIGRAWPQPRRRSASSRRFVQRYTASSTAAGVVALPVRAGLLVLIFFPANCEVSVLARS